MARVGQACGKVAVVAEEQQAFAVVVEPPDWIDVLAHALQEIDDGLPPLRIRSGRDDARRFVQQDVSLALRRAKTPAVHADVISRWIRLDPHLADRVAVDGNAAFLDQLLSSASRSYSGLGKQFLQPNTGTVVHGSIV